MGPTGPAGEAGSAGARGVVGLTGATGSTAAGAAGAMGRAGESGEKGTPGLAGTQGSLTIGPEGAPGSTGAAGPKGEIGAIGAQGSTGIVDHWVVYRELRFDPNRGDLQTSENTKLTEVVRYLQANPSLNVGIDSSMSPSGVEVHNQQVINARATSVRNALIEAGVPTARIQTGAFRDPNVPREGQLAVLIRSNN